MTPLTMKQKMYFDKTIKIKKVREAISSPTEYDFKGVFEAAGLKEDIDYFHQAAFTDDDSIIAVADFSIPKCKMIIELDGDDHETIKQVKKDYLRDSVFRYNDYQVIRIRVPLTNDRKSYWKNFIKYSFEDSLEI